MEASIVDLRYHMHDILKALDRREKVTVLFHDKPRGVIYPYPEKIYPNKAIEDHPYFGCQQKESEPVEQVMQRLRGGRY